MLSSTLRALGEGATKGPWAIEYESCDCGDGYPCHPPYPTVIVSQTATFIQNPNSKEFRREVAAEVFNIIEAEAAKPEDAALVCALRNNLPVILAALELAEADVRYAEACEDKKMHEEANVRAGGMRCFGMEPFDREVAESIIRKTDALRTFRSSSGEVRP